MPAEKNRNKIYVVAVICIGLITSIWLIQRTPVSKSAVNENSGTVAVKPYVNVEKNDDWKKMLVSIDNSKIDTSLISKNNYSIPEEDSTLTDQMSRDFLSQYLLAVKNDENITSADANNIAQNTLSLPDYNTSVGAKYLPSNLKIINKTDSNTLRIYRNRLLEVIKNRTSKVKDNPIMIVTVALSTEDEKELSKLDYIIKENRGFVSDLLKIEVPINVVGLHISLLNASSNLLTNLESLRVILGDPVRGLTGIGQYSQSINDLNLSLENLSNYFTKNL